MNNKGADQSVRKPRRQIFSRLIVLACRENIKIKTARMCLISFEYLNIPFILEGLCPHCKIHGGGGGDYVHVVKFIGWGGDYVHLYKNEQGGFCHRGRGGILSVSLLFGGSTVAEMVECWTVMG